MAPFLSLSLFLLLPPLFALAAKALLAPPGEALPSLGAFEMGCALLGLLLSLAGGLSFVLLVLALLGSSSVLNFFFALHQEGDL